MNIAVVCGLIILALLVVMLLAGVPIAVALAVSSICAILPVLNTGAAVLTGAQRIFSGISGKSHRYNSSRRLLYSSICAGFKSKQKLERSN